MGNISYRDQFIEIFEANIKRDGSERLMNYLKKSDFFTAPASTRFHGNFEGGLVEHSVKVYQCLLSLMENYKASMNGYEFSPESVAICSLLHDICKINYYKQSMRNVKNDKGEWEQKPFYQVDDTMPLGHGEKSAILLQQFMRMELPEIYAIRWHMGGFDSASRGGDYGISNAYNDNPLAVFMHAADLWASSLLEETKK